MSAIVFSGHRLDAPDREEPRFPASLAEAAARVLAERVAGVELGIASGANGGDILFLEACHAAGARLHMILPRPPERFVKGSVSTEVAGEWEARFGAMWGAAEVREVLEPGPDENVYEACNLALVDAALAAGPDSRALALWDGVRSGKPGGTDHFVDLVRGAGLPLDIIRPQDL